MTKKLSADKLQQNEPRIFAKASHRKHFLKKPVDRKWFVYLQILIYIVFFTILSFSQHDGLKSQMNDLGNMSQPIYNTTQGNFMFSSNYIIAEKYEVVRFGIHANYILLLFVPIYFLLANVKVLLLTQTILIGLGAYPLYLLSKEFFKEKSLIPILVPLLYLSNPMVQDVNLYDFHPLAIAMPLIIFSFYFLHIKRYLLFYFSALLLCITNEDMSLIVAMMGIYMFFAHRERTRGFVVFLLGIAYFFLTVQVIMPYFMDGHRLAIVHNRYSYLGGNVSEILKNIFLRPDIVLESVLTPAKLLYVTILLLPVLFFPLLSLKIFLLALPSLIINLLSLSEMTYYPFQYYHTAPILSFIFISTIFSIYKLRKYKNNILGLFTPTHLVISSLIFSFCLSPAPYSLVSSWKEFKVSDHAKNISEIHKIIPDSASLSIQNNLGAHFSHRKHIYTFPFLSDQADYVLIDVTDPHSVIRFTPRHLNFMFATQMSLGLYSQEVIKMFDNDSYSVIYYSDGYVLFEKGNANNDRSKTARLMFEDRFKDIRNKYEAFEKSKKNSII